MYVVSKVKRYVYKIYKFSSFTYRGTNIYIDYDFNFQFFAFRKKKKKGRIREYITYAVIFQDYVHYGTVL